MMVAKKTVARGNIAPKVEDRWQAQDDLSTLKRAAEIQGDKSRVAAAQREANSQVAALQKITGKK